MPGRHTQTENYRYAYNGMEQDNEIKGDGNSYTTEFRKYDPRLGRWLSLDPLKASYPNMSPYVAFNNNPIYFVDPLGLEGEESGDPPKEERLYTQPLRNYSTPEGGSITIPSKSYEQFDNNGNLISFSVFGIKYEHSIDKNGNFTGYKSKSGKLYTGKEIENLIPFYYSKEVRDEDYFLKWQLYSDSKAVVTEYKYAHAESIELRLTAILAGQKVNKALERFFKSKGLKYVNVSLFELEKLDVEVRNEYQSAQTQDWYGIIYYNPVNGHSYIIPLGVSSEYQSRVGVAKKRYRVMYQGHPTGIEKVETLDLIETKKVSKPPRAKNKY